MAYITLPPLYALPPVNMSILSLAPIKSSKHAIYKCALCPKEFYHKSSLYRHFLKHTGEKRFNCNVCRKRFNRKDLLNQHRKSRKCIIRSQIIIQLVYLKTTLNTQIFKTIQFTSYFKLCHRLKNKFSTINQRHFRSYPLFLENFDYKTIKY